MTSLLSGHQLAVLFEGATALYPERIGLTAYDRAPANLDTTWAAAQAAGSVELVWRYLRRRSRVRSL